MRSITPLAFLTALASLSLASACTSDEPGTKQAAEQVASSPGAGERADRAGGSVAGRSALPGPRRMRGSQEAGEAGAREGGEEARARWMERRAERAQMREERRARMAEMRRTFDTDGDGTLGDEERAAMRRKVMQDRLAAIDAGGDGAISREEASSSFGARRLLGDFDAADADGDSVVTQAELEAAAEARRARRGERGERFRDRWNRRRHRD